MVAMGALLWVILLALASMVEGGVLFSTLSKTLVVTSEIQRASPSEPEGVAKAGVDHIFVQWSLNSSFAGQDAMYSKVNIKLCFAPPSQVDRGWRKTKPDLHLDKTCSAAVVASQKYVAVGNSTVWEVAKKVPKAIYFIRAYAVDVNGNQLGFGQTTNKNKTTNLFTVEPITGRSTPMDIASAVFSVFAVGSLFSYLGFETLLARRRAMSGAISK